MVMKSSQLRYSNYNNVNYQLVQRKNWKGLMNIFHYVFPISNLRLTFTDLSTINAIQINNIGTAMVNILVSALPSRLPPKYKNVKNNKNLIANGIFLQLIIVGIRQNSAKTISVPFIGNLFSVLGF
jgi:hypothetical protein